MIDRIRLAVLFGLLGLACGLQCPKQKISPGREVVCYTSVSDVEQLTEAVCKCTTLVQKGHDVRNVSTSEFESFRKSLKEIIPTLQFVISVDDAGKTLRTSGTVRQEIAGRLIGVLKEVDGVELNVTAGSKERLLHFVKGLKDELVRKSYDKRIFLVLPTKSEDLAKQFDLKELTKYVDLFTIPTHYLAEDDEANRTFHPSRLMGLFDMFNADSLIDLISGLGAPKRKILMSVPASAYRFTLKDQDDNAPRAPTEEMQPVIIDQKQLCDYLNKGEWTVERDEDLTAPYAFNNKTWIAYEDKISVSIKGKYVMLRDLPGMAISDIDNDYKTKCGRPLTHEIHHSFSDFKRKSRAAVLTALEDDLHQIELEYPTQVKSSNFRVVRVVDTEGHIRAVRENTQTEFTCSRQGYFVHPKSCNRFYRCVKFNQEVEDYSVFEFDCPAGLSFDERTEVCVWPGSMPEGSPCPGSSEIAPVTRVRFECPSKPGYYADPQNPRWFFACIDLGGPEIMAYEFRCPYGLIFDEQKLICEWPWLVAGYSGSGYTRPEYDTYGKGYSGTGTTVGTGGYYTGGLPHGYTGTVAGGDYSGSTAGAGHAAGGYNGQGSTGYSGAGGHGSYGGQGSTGYSGTTGSGYSGQTGGHGVSYGGQGTGGYSGTTGSGFSGHGGAGGKGTGGYTGSAGAGGQGTGGYSGTTGSGFSGHGGAGGQGTGGYTGSAGPGGHEVSYGGQGSTGFSGTSGSGYSGSTGSGSHGISYGGQGGYSGTTGSGYAGHGGAGSQGTGGYSGTTGSGFSGHGGAGGQGTGGYSGTTGSGFSGHGGAGGQGTGGYTGSAGAGGQGTSGYSGTTGSGFSGHGGAGGQGTGGYSGTTGSGISGHGGAGGQGTGGYSGTIGSGFSGHGGAGGQGTGGYTGSAGAGGQGTGGYSGTTGSGFSGHGGAGGQGTGGYSGTTGSGISGHGGAGGQGTGGYSGTTGSGFSGHRGAGGQGTGGYTGSAGPGGHGVSYGGQGSTGFSGTTGSGYSGAAGAGAHGTSYGGQGSSGGYSGTTESGYTGSATAGHGSYDQGATGFSQTTGSGYSGSKTSQAGHGYTGSGTGGYPGSNGKTPGYGGSTGTGYTGAHGTGFAGATGSGQVSTGTGYTGTGGIGHGGTSGIYTGTVDTGSYSGSASTIAPGHGYSGQTTASGYSGSTSGGYSGTISSGQGGYSGTGGIHGGGSIGSGDGYSGSTSGGQAGVTGGYSGTGGIRGGATGGGYSGSTGAGYSGTTSGAQAGVTGGYSGNGGIHGGSSGRGYPGSTGGGYAGSTGTGYTGSGVYTGATAGAHAGASSTGFTSPAGGFSGGSSGTRVTVTGDYSGVKGGKYPGSSGGQHLGPSYGSTIPGTSAGIDYSGTGHGYTGQSGAKYPGGGSTGAGIDSTGVTGIHSQTPGPVFVDKPDQPTCITLGCFSGSSPSGGQSPIPGLTSGTGVYQGTGGYTGGLNVTFGSHIPSLGGVTPTYGVTATPGAGTIISGHSTPGSIATGPSTPGTLITYGGTSGTVIGGSSEPGTIITGGSHPGYTKTGAGTPGYVISDGVKTLYPGSASHGTVIYGTPSPGVIVTGAPGAGTVIKGQPVPGITLTGQTAPGVTIGGSIDQGTIVGSTGHHLFTNSGYSLHGGTSPPYGTKIGTVTSTYDTSYKTNEYHDNGGRGTIKFNNGDVTTKYTENDIPDYRPAGGTIPPDTLIPTGKGVPGASTPGGFTKAGPTKIGYTTSTLGGGGSYGISTGKIWPTPKPENIGPDAFKGSVAGYTKSSADSGIGGVTATYGQDSTHVDTSKITLGHSKIGGYSYPTPSIPFETGVTKNLPISATEGGVIGLTTPTPFLNVELYNTPKDADAYQRPSGFTRGPTSTPVAFTTGPLENYKTTAFEAAKIPVTISSVHPVFDTGYKTVVSSTPVPVTIGQDKYNVQTGSQFDFGTKQQAGGYVVSSTPSSPGSGYFGSTSKNVFGQGVTPSSVSESLKPQTQYLPSSISPAVGVTYRKPFPLPDVTYQSTTPGYPGYGIESSTIGGGSPTNVAIARDEVGKLITNYNRGTTKYVPSQYDVYSTGPASGADYSRTQTSGVDYSRTSGGSIYRQGYSSTTPASVARTQSPVAVTTYSGGYSRPSSAISYQTTAKSTAVGKGKVIVKWSDLHPLLLGKLGAECTCRGDPFANLRGPGSKLINSSKGKVDLSNYDESEIYVDLEKEGSYEDQEYVTNYESSTRGPVKIWSNQAPQLLASSSSQIQEKPSSTYLSGLSTPASINLGARAGISGFNSGFTANYRSAKSVNSESSTNLVPSTASPIDRSYETDGSEETFEGEGTTCARPGLFRHPNFCNKFYACHWDDWKKKFTLHVFNCPVHLTFDNGMAACNWPSMGPACQGNNLLV